MFITITVGNGKQAAQYTMNKEAGKALLAGVTEGVITLENGEGNGDELTDEQYNGLVEFQAWLQDKLQV